MLWNKPSLVSKRIASLEAAYRNAVAIVCHEHQVMMETTKVVEDTEVAQQVVQQIANELQQQAHHRIAAVVSRCLKAVFDEPYRCGITYRARRGVTEAELMFVRNDVAVDPMTECGGGVVDVAAFALRLAAILLSRPPLRRVLIMDEPFRFVSHSYRPRVRELLRSLAGELGVQFIIVTHFEDLCVGCATIQLE